MALNMFTYKGGVVSDPLTHITEKFLLFLIAGGKEVPFHEMKKLGLVSGTQDVDESTVRSQSGRRMVVATPQTLHKYTTAVSYGKVFVAQQGFGIQKRFHSFYIQFSQVAPVVTIHPFSGQDSPMMFAGKVKIMKDAEVLDIIEDPVSIRFVKDRGILPVQTMDRMVTVEEPGRGNVRMIRVKRE